MRQVVIMFTQPGCQPSAAQREFFQEHSVPFVEKDIRKDRKALLHVLRTGARATPVTEVGGEIVVGFDRERLSSLLNGVMAVA